MSQPQLDQAKWHLHITFNYRRAELLLPFVTERIEPYATQREVQAAFNRYRTNGDISVNFFRYLGPGVAPDPMVNGILPAAQDPKKWYLYLECWQKLPADEYTLPTRAYIECHSEHEARAKLEEYDRTFTPHGGHIYVAMLIMPAHFGVEPHVLVNNEG